MKITDQMIAKAYEIGKLFYEGKLTVTNGKDALAKIGMNSGSATDYIYNYSKLITGKLFTRTSNAYATDYYLNRIHLESGEIGLRNALLSLSLHLDYYESASKYKVKTRREIYEKYAAMLGDMSDNVVYPDEVDKEQDYTEGKVKQVVVNIYERNPDARKACIAKHGAICKVCDFDFEKIYGEVGKGFIHVHHTMELSKIKKEYSVNPINDLVPVCPNCHAMIHKRKPAYTVEELKGLIK